jgi:hypothetical protein
MVLGSGWRRRCSAVRVAAGRRIRLAVLLSGLATVCGGLGGLTASAVAGPPSSYRAGDLVRIDHFAQEEGALLGVALPGGPSHFIRLVESPLRQVPEANGPADADTDCVDAHGRAVGRAVRCTITIGTEAHDNAASNAVVIAHEVFHVFQAVMSGSLANFNPPGRTWLLEGSAQWVDSDLVSDDTYARGAWADYFTRPGVSLFARSYDAIGFFGHLASSGVDLWKRFPAIFRTTGNTAAYAAATLGAGNEFLDNEASVFFRDSSLGSAWDQEGQQHTTFADGNVPSPAGVSLYTASHQPFKPKKIQITATSGPRTITAAPYADTPVELDVHLSAANPLLEVTVQSGHARIHSTDDGGSVDAVNPVHVSFCGLAGHCTCPGNLTKVSGTFTHGDLAVTGGPTGGSVLITPGGCDLQSRSCPGLLPTSDFTEVPVPAGFDYTNGGMTEAPTGNPGQCQAQYDLYAGADTGGALLQTTEAGNWSIATYPDAAAAQQAFDTLLKTTGWNTEDQPVAGIGDEAYVGDGEGALLVRNDVFDVDWLNPMPDGLTVQQVLQNVVQTVDPGG